MVATRHNVYNAPYAYFHAGMARAARLKNMPQM